MKVPSARGLGIAMVAMVAFAGFAAGVVHAKEAAPRWRVKGAALTEAEEKKFEGKNTERLLLEVPNKTPLGLEFPNGKCKMEGKIKGSKPENPGTKKEVVLDCNSVVVYDPPKGVCTVHGVGQAAGLLKTNKLKSTLVWRNSTFGVTEDLLSAEAGNMGEFEVEGAACPAAAKGKYVIEKELLDELKPTAEEQKTGTILLHEPPVFEWWNNEIPRVKKTITQLAVSGTQSVVRGTFSYEVESGSLFGIFEG